MGCGFAWGRELLLGGMVALAGLIVAAMAAAPPPAPSALDTLQPGMWRIRLLGVKETPPLLLCVADPAALVQLRHRAATCSRMVISNAARETTVHYSCPGAGWGRTSLRVESAVQAAIDTQGIADNAPFAFRAEARRTGACAPVHSSSR